METIGLPTLFFTHSAADHHWPELARLLSPDDPDSSSSRAKAVIDNPALSDWFFSHRIHKFVEAFYVGVLGVSDYWYRFEWQHRGSPHIHGVAWLEDAPDVQQVMSSPEPDEDAKQHLIEYIDNIISTTNPAVQPDSSDVDSVPPLRVNPHICNIPYAEIQDFVQDLIYLIPTCQRHTWCSPSYCLRTKHGKQECRFGYPQQLQSETTIVIGEEEEPVVLTARNDGLVNNYNNQRGVAMSTSSS